ncbi:hypothetical protein LQZ19_06595 [Treponema primitia]|uniref:hypothetical protein n=1 Tax=Treponema primitia TaxID=88058 RepID=UPI00398091D7
MADDMTDEEYDALDELLTRTTPKLASGPQRGFFTDRARLREAQTIIVDAVTIQWVQDMAEKTHKTPTEIIGELVREKIAASA